MTDFHSLVQLLAAFYFSVSIDSLADRLYRLYEGTKVNLSSLKDSRSLTNDAEERPYKFEDLFHKYEVRTYFGILSIKFLGLLGLLSCIAYLYVSCIRCYPDSPAFWERVMPCFLFLPIILCLIIYKIYVADAGSEVREKLDKINDDYQKCLDCIVKKRLDQLPDEYKSKILMGATDEDGFFDNLILNRAMDRKNLIDKMIRTSLLFCVFDKVYHPLQKHVLKSKV